MRTLSLAAFLFLGTFALLAQPVDMSLFAHMKPRNIGPAGMSGRVTALEVNLQNPHIIYAGTASGGLWRTEGGGTAWGPTPDCGVFRTKDGAKSWERILYVDERTGAADQIVDPTNSN